jgi:hypothetical protein
MHGLRRMPICARFACMHKRQISLDARPFAALETKRNRNHMGLKPFDALSCQSYDVQFIHDPSIKVFVRYQRIINRPAALT